MNNNKKPTESTSNLKNEPETRVFARLISRSETKRIAGGQKCTGTDPQNGGPVKIDCIYE